MNVDILDLDSKIKKAYDAKCKTVPEMECTRRDIIELVDSCKNFLSVRVLRDLQLDLDEINSTINFLNFFQFYFVETRQILGKYVRLLQIPVENEFTHPNSANNVNIKKASLTYKYLDVITQTPGSEYCRIPYCRILDLALPCAQLSTTTCCDGVSYLCENVAICASCGGESLVASNCSTFSDSSRINMSSRYTYDRKNHFRDCIKQYQGKQDKNIPENVLQTVREMLNNLRISEINTSVAHISTILKSCGFTKYYDDAVLIHSIVTGTVPDNIEDLEEKLVQDFDLILGVFTKMFKDNERKNFNTQFVLYQLLLKYKHACNKNQLVKLRSCERKAFSDDVCRAIFAKLGWEYASVA